MSIYELSFRSTQPLGAVAMSCDRLRPLTPSDGDPIQDLRRLASQARYHLKHWLEIDTSRAALVYPPHLAWDRIAGSMARGYRSQASQAVVERLDTEPIDLADPIRSSLLFKFCNYQFNGIFKAMRSSHVLEARKRIYSLDPPKIIDNSAEALLYMTFDFNRDREGHLILVMDFAHEYRSRQSLDRWGLGNLKPRHRLSQTYDHKGCEWVGMADITIGERVAELGNRSLLDYHQEKGYLKNINPDRLDPQQRAVKIRYFNQTKEILHLPQLLQPLYDRSDLNKKTLDTLICSLTQKIEKAQKAIAAVNAKGFYCGDRLYFEPSLRHPPRLTTFVQGDRQRNLDFGVDCATNPQHRYYAEPWQGWNDQHLLQKPDRIRTQVLYPEAWEPRMKRYMQKLRETFLKFDIDLSPAGESRAYNPQDAMGLQRVCQGLPDACQLVFAFVPDSRDRSYNPHIDPYKTFKRQLHRAKLPSQMVTQDTMNQPGNSGRDQNVVFGILVKLGYLPWQLRSMPGTAQAFVGLDLGTKEGRTVGASAFVVDAHGQVIGWSSVSLQTGETFSDDSLRQILRGLFQEFELRTGNPLEHLVIHRDGTFKTRELATLKALEAELRTQGLQRLDLVEVVKQHLVRAAQRVEKNGTTTWDNPHRGWGWEHSPQEAIVLTTGKNETKISRHASPKPLLIRRRQGDTDLLVLAEQVYWLSKIHGGSSQTIRLPITTYYADRIAEVTLQGLLPPDVQREHCLYFV